jgi:hypothetical protein
MGLSSLYVGKSLSRAAPFESAAYMLVGLPICCGWLVGLEDDVYALILRLTRRTLLLVDKGY